MLLLFLRDQVAALRIGSHDVPRVSMGATDLVGGLDHSWIRVRRVVVEKENVACRLMTTNRGELGHDMVVGMHAIKKREVNTRNVHLGHFPPRIAAMKDQIARREIGVVAEQVSRSPLSDGI